MPLASFSSGTPVQNDDDTIERRAAPNSRGQVAYAANVGLGALVFAQFLEERPFSPVLAAAGFVVWLGLLSWALFLGRRHRDRPGN